MDDHKDGYARESTTMWRSLDKFEKESRKRLESQVRIWTADVCPQEFLESLVPSIPRKVCKTILMLEWKL